MKTLHLSLKGKWFDMILSGEKTEEYREIKPYWFMRLVFMPIKLLVYFGHTRFPTNQYVIENVLKQPVGKSMIAFKPFDTITFTNGYGSHMPTMIVECKGIEIGKAKPEWSDNWQGDVFVIKLGKILETKNLK